MAVSVTTTWQDHRARHPFSCLANASTARSEASQQLTLSITTPLRCVCSSSEVSTGKGYIPAVLYICVWVATAAECCNERTAGGVYHTAGSPDHQSLAVRKSCSNMWNSRKQLATARMGPTAKPPCAYLHPMSSTYVPCLDRMAGNRMIFATKANGPAGMPN